MKKTILFITFLILSCSVFAQNFGLQKSVEVRESVMAQLDNEQAIQSLNQTMTRFRERLRDGNRTYESFQIQQINSNNITVDAKRQGNLFGFIPFSVTEEVVFDNDGKILQTRESFWHRFTRFD